jgi:hypothetical protein
MQASSREDKEGIRKMAGLFSGKQSRSEFAFIQEKNELTKFAIDILNSPGSVTLLFSELINEKSSGRREK